MELVLGTAQLGMNYGISNNLGMPSREEAFQMLDTAFEHGIRIIDTATVYGTSEQIIGTYIKKYKRPFKIVTKLPKLSGDLDVEIAVKSHIQNSIDNLNIDHIDYYFLHNFKDMIETPGIYRCLEDNIENGTIRKSGVSLYEPRELEYLLYEYLGKVNAVQIPYNIFDNRWKQKDLLERTKEKGIEVFVRSIYLQGFFFLQEYKANNIHPKAGYYLKLLNSFCKEWNISIDQMAMQYVKSSSLIDYIVIGCENLEQVKRNIEIYEDDKTVISSSFEAYADQYFSEIEHVIIDPRLWKR